MFDFLEKQFCVEEWSPQWLVIDITRTCNEQCAHCIVAASPRHKNTIWMDNLINAIEDAAKNQFSSVGFYGGEPFTRKSILYSGVKEALKRWMTPQIMTNGFWWINEIKIDAILSELEDISRNNWWWRIFINLSTDEFHTKVPLKSLANIIHRWLERNDIKNLHIALSVWTWHINQNDIMNQMWDDIDSRWKYTSCWVVRPNEIMVGQDTNIRFIDTICTFPEDVEVTILRNKLVEMWIISEWMFETETSTQWLLMLVHANNFARLIKSPEDKEKKQFQVCKYHEKTIHWSGGYDFKLLWAGEQFLDDEDFIEKVSHRRSIASPEIRRHEKHELILLWLDNHFYISPSQLHYQISPMWENSQHWSIAHVIHQVRMRHPVARMILEWDFSYTQSAAVNALWYDSPLIEKTRLLAEKWLEYEAMYLLLKEKKVQEQLMWKWPNY